MFQALFSFPNISDFQLFTCGRALTYLAETDESEACCPSSYLSKNWVLRQKFQNFLSFWARSLVSSQNNKSSMKFEKISENSWNRG